MRTIVQLLPQYPWKMCPHRGPYLVLVNPYGRSNYRYYPRIKDDWNEAGVDWVAVVQRDIETLYRKFSDVRCYGNNLAVDAGSLGQDYEDRGEIL